MIYITFGSFEELMVDCLSFLLRFVSWKWHILPVKVYGLREKIFRGLTLKGKREKFEGSVSLLLNSKKFYFCVPRPSVYVYVCTCSYSVTEYAVLRFNVRGIAGFWPTLLDRERLTSVKT